MDAKAIGASLAKQLAQQQVQGAKVWYGEIKARRDDGSVTVVNAGGTVVASALASFDVGASIGKRVMVVEQDNVAIIVGCVAASDNWNDFGQLGDQVGQQGEQISQVEQAANDAAEKADQAHSAADAAQQAANQAGQAADQAQSSITSLTTTVNGVQTDLQTLTSTVSGVSNTADSALSAASAAQQDIDGFKTTASKTYETKSDADAAMAQEVLDRNSAISQSASSILSQVEQNYVNNTTGETFATKTEVQQTAESITQSVSETYQVKGDYLTTTEASETYATQSQLTQTADSITSSVSETYLTKSDASSTYATGEQLTDAINQEVLNRNSAIQQSADNVLLQVSEEYITTGEANGTFATQTQLNITSDSIVESITQKTQEIEDLQSQIGGVSDEVGSLGDQVDEVTAVVKRTIDPEGNPVVILSTSANDLQLQLTNSEISFIDSGVTVASISGQVIDIPRADVGQMAVGDYAWMPDTDGLGISLRYIGGS